MTESTDALVALPRGRQGTIIKWYVEKGERVHRGQRLATYETDGSKKELKSPTVGSVSSLLIKEGGSCEAKYANRKGKRQGCTGLFANLRQSTGSPTHWHAGLIKLW